MDKRYYAGVPVNGNVDDDEDDYDENGRYNLNEQHSYNQQYQQGNNRMALNTYEMQQQQPQQYEQEPEYAQQPQQLQQHYQEEQQEYYFQHKKIHNTGFWGDVKRRRGTFLVAFGALSICASIVMISVFWRWWWGPEVNVPCRVVGITLLILGVFLIIGGLISNALMFRNSDSKHFLGAPPRWSTWLLLSGLVLIVTAADFVTFYYSYWHNRFVNTPFISLGIVFFFFGTIFVIVGIRHNFKVMDRLYLTKQQQKHILQQNPQ